MDFYQGTPNLPMTGGDIFTEITEDIAELNDTVVFKAGTQTITGDKTITGDLVVSNVNTDIEGDSVLLRSVGDTKYQQDATTTIIDNTDIVQLRLGGSSVFSALASPHDTTITGDDNVFINSGTTKIDITPTNTLMDNTTTSIQSGGTTKIGINTTETLIENDEVFISNTAETVVLGIYPTSIYSVAPVGGNITQDIGTNTKQEITDTTTTLTNGNIYLTTTTGIIEAEAADKIVLNGLSAGVELEVNGVNKINCAAATTTNTNATITDVATTRQFQATAGTNVMTISSSIISAQQNISISKTDPTSTASVLTLSNGALSAGSPYLFVRKYTSSIFTGLTSQFSHSSIVKGLISGGVETTTDLMNWSAATGNFTLTAVGGTTNTGTIQGTTIQLVNGATTRFAQTNGATTITNTDVNVVGTFNITQGGDNINMIGNGLGGLFTAYYPDGAGAGRKGYFGYGNTGSDNFRMVNEYTTTNPVIELIVKNLSKAYFGNTDTYINNTTRVELQLNGAEKLAILNAETYIRNSNFIGAWVNNINRIDCYTGGNNYNFNPANNTATQRWRITDNGSQTNFRVQQNTTGVQLNNGNTAWSSLSDRRMKKGIEPIDKALEKINELNPVLFNYNEDPETRGKRFGFIAQEVQQVFPELVDDSGLCCNDFEGVVDECLDTYLSLETTSLIPYLVKAIQELNKKVEELTLRCSGGKSAETDISL